MKLLNHTTKYFSIAMLAIISIWAVIFYVNMLDEVYDSLDDGLDNYRMLIIQKAHRDSTILYKTQFEESNYAIYEIAQEDALSQKDVYRDTLMYMQNEEDYEPVRILTTAFEQHGHYYRLNVISSMVEEDDLIEDLFFALIWLYVVMVLSIIIVNNVLLKKIWKPFYYLLDQLNVFVLKKETAISTQPTVVDEFRLLNTTVTQLLNTALETYENQKQFIENASHELQTPLAISINKLELLAEKNILSEQDANEVGRVIQTLERLTRLNKSLLLLSKIENKQFQDSHPVNINAIVKNMIVEFEDFAAFKKVHVAVDEQGQLQKTMPRELAEALFSNLLKNAILHNVPDGTVEIRITPLDVAIINTGGKTVLDNERIFDRFHKKTTEANSIGMGLAIVKAIADGYGLTVTYSYSGFHKMLVSFSQG